MSDIKANKDSKFKSNESVKTFSKQMEIPSKLNSFNNASKNVDQMSELNYFNDTKFKNNENNRLQTKHKLKQKEKIQTFNISKIIRFKRQF